MTTAAFVTQVFVPFAVFVILTIVGLGIGPGEMRRAFRSASSLVIITSIQLGLVPAIAIVTVRQLGVEPAFAMALLLLAISPGGALSNYFVYINRGRVALSVVLTATTTIIAIGAYPLLAAVLLPFVSPAGGEVDLPVATLMLQLFGFVLAPVLLGMMLRHRYGETILAYRRAFDRIATLLVALTVVQAVASGWPAVEHALGEIFGIAAVFTLVVMVVAQLAGLVLPRGDRSACTIECTVRNVPVALMLMDDVIGDAAALGFASVYFLTNVSMVAAFSLATRDRAALPAE